MFAAGYVETNDSSSNSSNNNNNNAFGVLHSGRRGTAQYWLLINCADVDSRSFEHLFKITDGRFSSRFTGDSLARDSHPAFQRALKSHLFQCAFIA